MILMNNDELRDKINLDDLYNRTRQTNDLRLLVYKKILNRTHQKIKYVSRQKNTEHYCFFVVPEFLVGTPILKRNTDIKLMVLEIMWKKQRNLIIMSLTPRT